MTREPVLRNQFAKDDRDRHLRPQRVREMVGQRDVIERLRIALDAARKRGDPLGHLLFDGPPGLGKTTFAFCVPRELDVRIQVTTGAALKAPKDLVSYLSNAEERSVVFIDEIHRLPPAVEEYLYPAMEDYRLDIVMGEGLNARTLNLSLKPFTLIGATTRAGMLSGPLRDRFRIREHLGFYSVEELTELVVRNAAKLSVEIDAQAAVEIAGRSRGTPRIANNQLLWVRDFADSRADGRITLKVARDALQMAEVDSLGLGKQDRRYLETIIRVFDGGPAGVEAIAHTMNTSKDTLSDEVEPFLLRSEMVIRTPRGRKVTANAYHHLNMALPGANDEDPQQALF